MTINDLPVGRSVDETLRLVKAFQVRRAFRGQAGLCWLHLSRAAGRERLAPLARQPCVGKHS